MEKLQTDREKRSKIKANSGEQDSTSLSASALERKVSVSETNHNENYLGIRGFIIRICKKLCMGPEEGEER